MPYLEPNESQQLNKLLSKIPQLQTESGRRTLLNLAGLNEFVSRINLAGSTTIVVGEIVTILWNYGRFEDGDTALGKLLITIKESTGQDNKEFIARLIRKYKLIKLQANSQDLQTDNLESKVTLTNTQVSNFVEAKPKIGIITALPKEYAAVKQLLKNSEEIQIPGAGAGRRYIQGEIPARSGGKHSVILCLADMGNNQASSRATLLLEHFPDLDSIIMVGIAGGIPNPGKTEEHVRLGDIVISDRKGVIQYDFIKETLEENKDRHPPRPPSAVLLEGVRLQEAEELEGKQPWLEFIASALLPPGEERPSAETDILVSSSEPTTQIEHPLDKKRKPGEPRVFTGPIASANRLLKNPLTRDRLRDCFGVKAVEMEGSGIADATWNHEKGYLVVRGICDYCDANKNDLWQPYAAAVAAAYTRALLESMPCKQPPDT